MRIPLRLHARGTPGTRDTSARTLPDARPGSVRDATPVRRIRRVRICRASPGSAEALEREILGHTRRVARLRFARGRLAHQFLLRKCWASLGFVRIGDYTRECLGVAARSLQEDARAARALDQLPQAMVAFLEARLSWTQVRLLTLVARAGDESQWISRALECDTRTLEAEVRRHAECNGLPVPDQSDEPVTKFNVRVSRFGRRLWRAAREMAERSAGTPLSPAQVLELVAAEVSSGAHRAEIGAPPTDQDPDSFPAGDAPARACRTMDRDPELTRSLAEIEAGQAEAEATGMGWAEHSRRRESATPRIADAEALLLDELRRLADEEDIPHLLLPAHGDSPEDRPDASFDRYEASSPLALDARMREIGAALKRADSELARLLREALDSKVHRVRGFESFDRYVSERLDFCSRLAWILISIDRAADRLGGEFLRAYREGRISLLAAQAILPVVASLHGRAWIDRAGTVTLRRLKLEVEWALDQRDAASGPDALDPVAPPPLDAELTPHAGVLEPARLKMRALGEPAPAAETEAADHVTLCFNVPASIARLVEDTMLAVRKGSESRGEAFERMLALALLEWMAAPRHRDPVFERDGWRCAVPCCSSRRELHDHHLRFRSLGGDESLGNRATVCAAHHLRFIHTGRIRARGSAPSAIVWEFVPGQAPYMKFVGDRYVARPATYSSNPASAVPKSVGSMPTRARKIA